MKQICPTAISRRQFSRGYGCTLVVGLGVPIPVLDEEIAAQTGVSDADIQAPVVDYATAYPERRPDVIQHVTYADLKSGTINVIGKPIEATPLSSYPGQPRSR